MKKTKKMAIALLVGKAFILSLLGCPNSSSGPGSNNNNQGGNQTPTLQQAIDWVNAPSRAIETADGQTMTLDQVGGRPTIISALTNSWNTTYINNPTGWTQVRWKQIMNDVMIGNFSSNQLPLTISKLSVQLALNS